MNPQNIKVIFWRNFPEYHFAKVAEFIGLIPADAVVELKKTTGINFYDKEAKEISLEVLYHGN